jgi:flagellin-like hook-associated protein FlgL
VINVISTADGALSEVSKLLLEIKSLVNQSSNEGALSDDEVQANQNQINSLLESINRVANSTQFNGKKLLNGQLGYTVSSQDQTQLARLQIFGARVPSGNAQTVTVQVTQSAQTGRISIGLGGNNGLSASGRLSEGSLTAIAHEYEIDGLASTSGEVARSPGAQNLQLRLCLRPPKTGRGRFRTIESKPTSWWFGPLQSLKEGFFHKSKSLGSDKEGRELAGGCANHNKSSLRA